jgi:hypothetical protein
MWNERNPLQYIQGDAIASEPCVLRGRASKPTRNETSQAVCENAMIGRDTDTSPTLAAAKGWPSARAAVAIGAMDGAVPVVGTCRGRRAMASVYYLVARGAAQDSRAQRGGDEVCSQVWRGVVSGGIVSHPSRQQSGVVGRGGAVG